MIYLDMNRLVCLKSWLGRVIQNWGHARPDMAEGCKEWIDPEFAAWIWNFNKNNRKRYYELLEQQTEKKVLIFKNRRQVAKFLESL